MNYSLFVITGLFIIGFSFSSVYAHVTIEVGPYEIEIGWLDEPPVLNNLNAITIDVKEPGDVEGVYMGVTNAFRNLDATVISGGISKSLDIQSGKYPAEYYGEIIPTNTGQVVIKLVGEINGIEIDELIRIEDVESGSADHIIPRWIKNNAGWWADDKIPDSAFLKGIKYLIQEGIMIIPSTEKSQSFGDPDAIPDAGQRADAFDQHVPPWIKNNAGWWADGKIPDSVFVKGIQFLIKEGIIDV